MNFPMAAAGGIGAGFLNSMYNNPYDAASGYFDKGVNAMHSALDPYSQMGQNMIPGMQDFYNKILSNPGGFVNSIGSNYQQSPGFKFQLSQGENAVNNAAQAGGMTGSPQAQMNAASMATNMANQNYNQYMQNALNTFGMGLGGQQNLFNQGYDASKTLGAGLGNLYQNQGGLAYQGANQQNQNTNSLIGAAATIAGWL